MSTIAQITANRENAQSSTGPKTTEGKTRSAHNAVTLGLFTMNDFVLPEESAEHGRFCATFWQHLQPTGPVQETFATEMIRAAWRLRRCGLAEAGVAHALSQNEANIAVQAAIDRARAQANNIFRRAHSDLRRLQAEPAPVPNQRPDLTLAGTEPEPDPAPPAESPLTNQSQSVPRGGPCPCNSGEKYKRCCGRNAPGLVHQAA